MILPAFVIALVLAPAAPEASATTETATKAQARDLWISVRQVFDRRRPLRPGAADAELNPDAVELQGAVANPRFRGFEGEVQTLRAQDGSEAVIAIERDVPPGRREATVKGRSAAVVDDWLFSALGPGFVLVPHVDGGEVTIEVVSRQNPEPDRERELRTPVSGKVGSWIEIGRVLEQHADRLANGTEPPEDRTGYSVLVKVEAR
jgi:hypothetical protein